MISPTKKVVGMFDYDDAIALKEIFTNFLRDLENKLMKIKDF